MKRCLLLMTLVIALAACASAASPSSVLPTPAVNVSPVIVPSVTPTASFASPEPSDVAATATDGRVAVFPDTIIVYQREGGFTGQSEKWSIYSTGRIVAGDGTEWQVPPEQVAPLFTLVESPGFESLNAMYPAAGACNDCYVHTVTVFGQGEPQTVTFVEGADLPPYLQQLLGELNTAIAR